MNKKESRHFNISVEGINCEKMYFEHLAKLINSSDRSTYNLKVAPRKMGPLEYAKRNAYKPVESLKNKALPYIHIQDIENYYDDFQRSKFFGIIDEMREAEKKFNVSYELGYSNYSFELWMLLHVSDMNYAIHDRESYLKPINEFFHRKFSDLNEFKSHDEFQMILEEFVTLDSVKLAVRRAEKIVQDNNRNKKVKENYRGFAFFHDNPDVTVHEVVRLIFEVCGVK